MNTPNPLKTLRNLPAVLSNCHGCVAMPMTAMMYDPRRILMYFGQRPAISMPVDTEFKTTEICEHVRDEAPGQYDQSQSGQKRTASCELTSPKLPKKTPALDLELEW